MDQQSQISIETLILEDRPSQNLFFKKLSSSNSNLSDKDSLNLNKAESEKTLKHNNLEEFMKFSEKNELNKNDLKNFIDLEKDKNESCYNINHYDYDFIIKNENYFYLCKNCRIIVGNDYSVNYVSNFIEMTKFFNVRRNIDNDAFTYYTCVICNGVVGFYSKREKKNYLISDMIKIKDDKKVNIGLFGLKEEYLQMFQNYLEVLSEKFNCFSKIENNYKLVFKHYKMTKESLNKNYKQIKADELDCAYIVHKNEGRLFLLGRNGYYNKLIEDIFSKLYGRVAFVLINNENTRTEEIMEKLIYKGEQKSLHLFQKENKFFFVDHEILSNLIPNEKFFFHNLQFCYQQFSVLDKNLYMINRNDYMINLNNLIDHNDRYLIKTDGPEINSDIDCKIKYFLDNYDKIKNGKSNNLCFML